MLSLAPSRLITLSQRSDSSTQAKNGTGDHLAQHGHDAPSSSFAHRAADCPALFMYCRQVAYNEVGSQVRMQILILMRI